MNIKQPSALLLATSCCAMLQAQKATSDRPNVVFILVDDYGWSDTSYNGSTFYETPNIDRLANEGMRFTNGYAAASVSSPTRVSILTGKYPARTHITDWIPGYQHGLNSEQLSSYKLISPPMVLNMPLSEVTVAEAMKEGGYATYFVGKWHCAEDEGFYPQHQGFDVNIGGWLKGSPNGNRRVEDEGGAYYTPYHNPYLPDGPKGEFLTDRLGDEAVKLIHSSGDKPFLLYLSFYAVHTPIEAKPEKTAYFREKAKRLGLDKNEPFTLEVDWLRNADRKAPHWKERRIQSDPEYAALISSMDDNVGKVLDSMRANGLDKNTIVCFLSDNGGLSTAEGSPTTNAPLRGGKGWLYEGGIREPYIIKYPPLVKAGSSCSVPVISTDFYPTLLELAGLSQRPEQHCDGVSIVPLLKGEKQDRGTLYFHYPNYGGKGDAPSGAIREGDYKLIEFFEDGHTELYNLKKDISESNDLSENEPERAERMLHQLREWRKQCGAWMPTKNENYKK